MTNAVSFQPNWATPPGDTISDFLAAKNLSKEDLADEIGQRLEWVESLIHGKTKINDQIAQDLEAALGASAAFWVNRESQYREDLARIKFTQEPADEREWLSSLPVSDMVKFGWIKKPSTLKEKLALCLDFFGVTSIKEWHENYHNSLEVAAFRTSLSFEQNPASVAAWLRQGEKIGNTIKCAPWNKKKFQESLVQIRSMTKWRDPAQFLPEIKRICAECGVAVVIARAPKGCPASGVTKFLSSNKALLMLSFRYKTEDHFWFTFFHEAAHLLLHTDKAVFIEQAGSLFTDEEEEANLFSANFLIPVEFQQAMETLKPIYKDVVRFSVKVGISPGIVVGQMQHKKLLRPDQLNYLKRRYDWNN